MVAASIPNPSHANIETGVTQAEGIAPVTILEASQIATVEVNRVLDLLAQLDGDDWKQPTDCTEWNIQDIAAHLAGACAGWATWKDFRRQAVFNPHIFKTSVAVDGINKRQLEDRAGQTPQQLVDELREMGPKAVQIRKNLPGVLRAIRMPAQPMPGWMSVGYLIDVIYPRDQWMHRMDICRATGKSLLTTPVHDGRLMDLVMRDIAEKLDGSIPVIVTITGALDASYRFGSAEPAAELEIEYTTMNRRASGRIAVDATLAAAHTQGDEALARRFLENCEILY